MITIEQLLESVDLDFEPRFVTKDEDGSIWIWNIKPDKHECWRLKQGINSFYGRFISERLKLAEFEGKDWTECIYEVPQKTTGKIKKLECYELADKEFNPTGKFEPMCYMTLIQTINSLVDAVNELRGRQAPHKHPISNPQAKGAKNE